MVQQVKALDPQDIHSGKTETAPTNCPLTFTYHETHMYPCVKAHMHAK